MAFIDVLAEYGCCEVSPVDFYRDIFPDGSIERRGEYRTGEFIGNPIGVFQTERKGEEYKFHQIILNDLEGLKELQQSSFSILSGLTYFGRRNVLEHASKMYAMIFDIDGVTDKGLARFIYGTRCDLNIYPAPQYIVLSGSGIHLYYLFEEPIPLYPNIKLQLKELKYALTRKIWNMYVSDIKEPQYQGINQGFRVVGGKTKKGGIVRAFRCSEKKITLSYLNEFVQEQYRIDETKLFPDTSMSLIEAAAAYPEWYQKRVIDGEPKGRWHVSRRLYEWWKRQILSGATYHHRYYCIMLLAIIARKCSYYDKKHNPNPVTYEELEKDAYELQEYLNGIKPDEPFTKTDIKAALECFDSNFIDMTRKECERVTAINIPAQKRNYRKQSLHLKLARSNRDILCEERGKSDWRDGNGRPSKGFIVYEWRQQHPDGRKADCIRDTKLSKPTVLKWWDYNPPTVRQISPNVRQEINEYRQGHIVVTIPQILIDLDKERELAEKENNSDDDN